MADSQPEAIITCIECGGRAHLLTPESPDDPFQDGDVVAYRCEDCLDRFDVVVGDDEP